MDMIHYAGKDYALRVSPAAILRYEKAAGVDLMESMQGAMKKSDAPDSERGMGLLGSVCATVEQATLLVYECSEVCKAASFEDFSEGADLSVIMSTRMTIVLGIIKAMSTVPDFQKATPAE